MAKINFNTKSAKALRVSANQEFKGMNHAIKAVLVVWKNGTNDADLAESIKAAKADGIKANDFSAEFIVKYLNGTNDCKDGVIGSTHKGEFKARTAWNAGQVIDYVRKANRARIMAENKAAKENKESK